MLKKSGALLLALLLLLSLVSCTPGVRPADAETTGTVVQTLPPEPTAPAVSGFRDVYDYSGFETDLVYVQRALFLGQNKVLVLGTNLARQSVCRMLDLAGGWCTFDCIAEPDSIQSVGGSLLVTSPYRLAWYPDPAASREKYEYRGVDYPGAVCTPDGFVYVINDRLVFVNGKTGRVERGVPLPDKVKNVPHSYFITCSDSGTVFYLYDQYEEGSAGCLSVEPGSDSCREIPCGSDAYLCGGVGNRAVIRYYARSDFAVLADGLDVNRTVYFKSTEETAEGQPEGRFLLTSQLDYEHYLRVYDLETGDCTARLDTPFSGGENGDGYLSTMDVSADGSLVFAAFNRYGDNETTPEFYLFRTAGHDPEPGAYTPVFKEDAPDPAALSGELRRAYEIGCRYGVTVRCGETAAASGNYYSHDVLPDGKLSEALTALENILSKYPDCFFRELCTGSYRRLVINLTGTIRERDTGTYAGVGGYFNATAGRLTAAVTVDADCNFGLESTIAHELMHAADSYIAFRRFGVENDGYPEWSALNPAGFSYNNSYSDEDGEGYFNVDYTYGDFDSPLPVYFIDVYSKTFAIEDRARIFERAFVNGDGFSCDEAPTKALQCEHIIAKERCLFRTYREVFETVRDAPSVFWERNLPAA